MTGYTYASIVGGQTANTEFELLTGNTLGFLSAGTTAFQLYIHGQMPSLVSNLKAEGYSGNKAIRSIRIIIIDQLYIKILDLRILLINLTFLRM